MNKLFLFRIGSFETSNEKSKRRGAYHLHNKSVEYFQYKHTTIKFEFLGEETSARSCLISLKD